MRFKFGEIKPFPDKPGTWFRICLKGTGVVQGHVLQFDGDKVFDLANGNQAMPETVMQGDELSAKDEITVTYTQLEGVAVKFPTAPGQQPPSRNGSGGPPEARKDTKK